MLNASQSIEFTWRTSEWTFFVDAIHLIKWYAKFDDQYDGCQAHLIASCVSFVNVSWTAGWIRSLRTVARYWNIPKLKDSIIWPIEIYTIRKGMNGGVQRQKYRRIALKYRVIEDFFECVKTPQNFIKNQDIIYIYGYGFYLSKGHHFPIHIKYEILLLQFPIIYTFLLLLRVILKILSMANGKRENMVRKSISYYYSIQSTKTLSSHYAYDLHSIFNYICSCFFFCSLFFYYVCVVIDSSGS